MQNVVNFEAFEKDAGAMVINEVNDEKLVQKRRNIRF